MELILMRESKFYDKYKLMDSNDGVVMRCMSNGFSSEGPFENVSDISIQEAGKYKIWVFIEHLKTPFIFSPRCPLELRYFTYWSEEEKVKTMGFIVMIQQIILSNCLNVLEYQEWFGKFKLQQLEKITCIKKKLGELDAPMIEIGIYKNIVIEFSKIYQKQIQDFDHKSILNIVRINKFMERRRIYLIDIFKILVDAQSKLEFDYLSEEYDKEFIFFEELVVHAFNMIASIKVYDLFTYYELIEFFNELDALNSKWENDIISKFAEIRSDLNNIKENLININGTLQSFKSEYFHHIANLKYLNSVNQENFQILKSEVLLGLNDLNKSSRNLILMNGIKRVYGNWNI